MPPLSPYIFRRFLIRSRVNLRSGSQIQMRGLLDNWWVISWFICCLSLELQDQTCIFNECVYYINLYTPCIWRNKSVLIKPVKAYYYFGYVGRRWKSRLISLYHICTDCNSSYATTELPNSHEDYFRYNFVKYLCNFCSQKCSLQRHVYIMGWNWKTNAFWADLILPETKWDQPLAVAPHNVMGPFCSWLPARQALIESKLNTQVS